MQRNILLIIAFGVSLGLFTSLGQTYLPDPFTQLANAYSVWLLAAFISGALVTRYRWALVSGVAIQYIALLTYYALINLRFDDSGFNAASNVIWLVGGTLVGPVAGFCGRAFASKSKYGGFAAGFVVAMILSEALYQFINLHYVGEGLVFLALGGFTAAYVLWKHDRWPETLLSAAVVTALAYVGYVFVLTPLFS
ncbi:MAG TPA: DUF6518 family protein [Candidatus Saccharimonadales bacterium]